MKNYFKLHPRMSWIMLGAIVGVNIGLFFIGNMGLTRGGTGHPIWGWVFGGLVGAYIGFRIGEWRLRRG